MSDPDTNRRVLVVDDTPSIHEDFRKILSRSTDVEDNGLADARALFFGNDAQPEAEEETVGGPVDAGNAAFELGSALQGMDALELVKKGIEEGKPYAMAFVDIRMPPGWDGVQTIRELWKVDPKLQCVICTAFSDYSWEQTVDALGRSDRLLILKKPFDPVEIRQFATALTEKWNSSERERAARKAIEAKEAEMRAYAASLEMANQALKTSKATADRTAEVKQTFLERLTADIGENLQTILGELLEQGATTGLESTLDRSRRLLETVGRALDLSRLEQGALDVQVAECDLRAMIASVEARQRPVAEERGLDLIVEVAPDVPTRVVTDAGRLEEVLDQLVSNALRFTQDGHVTLRVQDQPTMSWEVARVRFEVRDSGPGVDADETGLLFEPFRSRDRGDVEAGSGLGLAVTKQIARLLGGDVMYQTSPEGGAVFSLTLDFPRR